MLTYHAMALRLTGMSLGTLAQADQEPDFDDVLRRAVDLLEGRVEAGADRRRAARPAAARATASSSSTSTRTSMRSNTRW